MAKTHVVTTSTVKGRGKKRKPTRAAQAERGKGLIAVRTGTPLQIEVAMHDMEAKALLSDGIVRDADDNVETQIGSEDALLEDNLLDCDVDFTDEDVYKADADSGVWCEHSIRGDGSWYTEDFAFDPVKRIVIVVSSNSDGTVSCNLEKDMRIGYDTNSLEAADMLNELASRYEVLNRLGEWLSEARADFLRTGDLWSFAENALSEASERHSSVVQEDLIKIARLNCRGDSFSRFVRNVVLSWGSNGSMDLAWLFSKEAKCAWVARAYREFCSLVKAKDMQSALETLQNCRADKKSASARMSGSIMSMSSRWVAERLCSLAHVKGQDVALLYGQKILEV